MRGSCWSHNKCETLTSSHLEILVNKSTNKMQTCSNFIKILFIQNSELLVAMAKSCPSKHGGNKLIFCDSKITMGELIDILFVKLLLKALLRYYNGNVSMVLRKKVTFVDDYSHIVIVSVFTHHWFNYSYSFSHIIHFLCFIVICVNQSFVLSMHYLFDFHLLHSIFIKVYLSFFFFFLGFNLPSTFCALMSLASI